MINGLLAELITILGSLLSLIPKVVTWSEVMRSHGGGRLTHIKYIITLQNGEIFVVDAYHKSSQTNGYMVTID